MFSYLMAHGIFLFLGNLEYERGLGFCKKETKHKMAGHDAVVFFTEYRWFMDWRVYDIPISVSFSTLFRFEFLANNIRALCAVFFVLNLDDDANLSFHNFHSQPRSNEIEEPCFPSPALLSSKTPLSSAS